MMRSTYGRMSSRAPHAWASTAVWIALMQMASPAQASPGDTDLVSVSPTTGMSGSGNSDFGTKGAAQPVSADGRFVVFTSGAPDLVAGPSNDRWQVYLRDRGAGTTERISVTPAGLYGNNDSTNASINADGRYVAFVSLASDLVPGDTNGVFDVFVRDRQTGVTERVSVSSNGTQVGGWSDERISLSRKEISHAREHYQYSPFSLDGHAGCSVHFWNRAIVGTR